MNTNPETFTLDGNGPAFSHAHSRDFKPHTEAQKLRQDIVRILACDPDVEVAVSGIALALGVKYSKAYAQCKFLCLRGFATRSEEQRWRDTKKGKVPCGKTVKIQYVQPFSAKIGPGKDAGGKTLRSLW